jgi:hypothetical protein
MGVKTQNSGSYLYTFWRWGIQMAMYGNRITISINIIFKKWGGG